MTPPAPLTVVLNPHAGRGQALRAWPRLERELRARGLTFESVIVQSAAGALAHVAALPEGQSVLTVGGDGTVHALLPALIGTHRPLASVPLGSGNDFAGMWGLQPGDLAAALDRLTRVPQAVDALWADHGAGRAPLLNGLGMGLDARVAELLGKAPARLGGSGRYLWAALNTVRELRVSEVEVTLDGRAVYAGPAVLAAVMNGTRYGGGFRISPHADPRDGLLDVVLGGGLSRAQLLPLLARVLRGAHLGHPGVHAWRGREVRLRWNTPTPTHLDGEVVGAWTELRAGVLPGAVRMY